MSNNNKCISIKKITTPSSSEVSAHEEIRNSLTKFVDAKPSFMSQSKDKSTNSFTQVKPQK